MKKAIMFSFFLLLALMLVHSASAIVVNSAPYPNGIAYGYASYGSHPINPSLTGRSYPYSLTPVRTGGFFGANSAFLIGLKPGIYDGPVWNGYTRQVIASAYYPRVGGTYGYSRNIGGYYYGLRPGTFTFNGAGTGYSNVNYRTHGVM